LPAASIVGRAADRLLDAVPSSVLNCITATGDDPRQD
jgi:hypothetical protein